MNDISGSFVWVRFCDGKECMVRDELSGIVLDDKGKPISNELMADLLACKAWRLSITAAHGRC